MNRLRAGGLIAAAVAATIALVPRAAAADPGPNPVPGGLTPTQAAAQHAAEAHAAAVGSDCIATEPGGVCIVKSGPSCTGYSSQTTPPTTIRVLVHKPSLQIVTVPFQQYVENVLPNEWIPSWDGDALKAGAVAVKSYAWYWVTHFGGYLNTNTANTCFDVTDDTLFQVYKAGSAQSRTNTAVVQSWPVVARRNGAVLQAGYNAFLQSQTESCGQGATGAVLSQWGSQNCVEENTGNKYNVILQKYYFPGLQLATQRQLRTPHDFTFEQTSTRATFAAGHWVLNDGYPTTFSFGTTGDLPTITDSGDGFAQIGVFRPSNGRWYLGGPTGNVAQIVQWGTNGDVPVAGHYNGLGQPSVLAVWRPSSGRWYIQGRASVQFGAAGDVPVPGDYDGDRTTETAVFRPSNGKWYINGQPGVQFGTMGDIPVPADYDGNGSTDLAVFRPSNGNWYIRGRATVHFGTTGDIPVTGDFNGDGHADIAVYRPGNNTWFTSGQSSVVFGGAGVTPIGAAPYRG